MAIPYELFISLKYLKAKRKQTFISIITLISIGGVALGVMALIIVLAVMNGFERDLRDKILGINSHLVVFEDSLGGMGDYRRVIEEVKKVAHVVSAAPFISGQVILKSNIGAMGVLLNGIDPREENKVTILAKSLREGAMDFSLGKDGEGIVVGKELARNLGVKLDSKITLLSPAGTITPLGIIPRMEQFRIVGIFDSGMYEYDSTFAYVSLKAAQRILGLGNSVTGVKVRIDEIFQAQKVATLIQRRLSYPYWVRSWMETNRSLFSALKLEKIVMFIILALIIFVAAFNIASTLTLVVMDKTKDIGILKSMGASAGSIMFIFLLEGLIIGILGAIIGGVAGVSISWALEKYQFIKLPGDIYYISTLPVEMRTIDIILISLAAIGISLLATIYPAWQAAKLDPVEALRYE